MDRLHSHSYTRWTADLNASMASRLEAVRACAAFVIANAKPQSGPET